ncbi:hypothetical protein IG631_05499 [Alternaria alternata]|nr:hypothetical protein IG631_05499 [Alternaria alternata]
MFTQPRSSYVWAEQTRSTSKTVHTRANQRSCSPAKTSVFLLMRWRRRRCSAVSYCARLARPRLVPDRVLAYLRVRTTSTGNRFQKFLRTRQVLCVVRQSFHANLTPITSSHGRDDNLTPCASPSSLFVPSLHLDHPVIKPAPHAAASSHQA